MRRVAVVGSGIAGLAAARALAGVARVTLFESAERFGGHSHTVDVTLDGVTHGVDTGFLVFNAKTYPRLSRLFTELGVETAPAEMSFSFQSRPEAIEWSGRDLAGVFAQRANLARPRFWSMLAEIVRFNRLATREAARPATQPHMAAQTLGAFLAEHRFAASFRNWYLLPMLACVWSCPAARMLDSPMPAMARFCANHGLLQLTGRPPWRTVLGGARRYVAKMLESVADARLRTPVRSLRRLAGGGIEVATDAGGERFNAAVLACHSDQALAVLAEPSADERRVLGTIRSQDNRAVLHTDASLLPRRRAAWAAWNCERGAGDGAPVCLHYLINRLQPLPFATSVIVSLNPVREPAPARIVAAFAYAHPILDAPAVAAQGDLAALQGRGGVWFCGAWTGNGFHEDGLASGLAAAAGVARALVHDVALAEPVAA